MGTGDETVTAEGVTQLKALTGIERYLKYEPLMIAGMVFAFIAIETTINASTLLLKARSSGSALEAWIPFTEEYTSGLAIFLLVPVVLWFEHRFPLNWNQFRRNIAWHILGSLGFSVLHITLMTIFRKLVFYLNGLHYDPGEFLGVVAYEYRIDAWTYATILIAAYVYRFIIKRLHAEASLVSEGESPGNEAVPDRLLVKKLGKEFIVKVDDIEWFESAGNYVNLHVAGRIYPLRSTLSALVAQLEPRGFRRIHRSHGVNLESVASITPLESGDARLTLENGQTLNLSRRYREAFRKELEF